MKHRFKIFSLISPIKIIFALIKRMNIQNWTNIPALINLTHFETYDVTFSFINFVYYLFLYNVYMFE